MWSSVAPYDNDGPAPSARSKHSATLVGQYVYLLGGRNGNIPCKDFWRYHLVSGVWEQLNPGGDKLPNLQEHSAVAYKDNIYVFGGEMSFSSSTETPLWVYDIKNNNWKKIKSQKGVVTPKGRRGHSALVHKGTMLIYGGYQDLRGSCNELWAFHFETESWHLISGCTSNKNGTSDLCPPARHKHSAILYEDSMWIYGGMTDLQPRSDLWKWDTISNTWTNMKTKLNPGPLHSHAVSRLPSSMIIFGGERDGHTINDLWKFSFTSETWEKVNLSGLKPQPRAETVALTVSELLLKDVSTSTSLESKVVRTRSRTCNSADRSNRHSSYLPSNRVSPCEKTYVFTPSQNNYIDGSNLAHQYSECDNRNGKGGILQEISKLSHLNLTRNKCSYTILSGCGTDSTENLLRQYASPPQKDTDEITLPTPIRRSLVKSKSAYAIKRNKDSPPESENGPKVQKHVEFAEGTKKMTKEPISVPNFSVITLPTPVLTPVEAARLVFLDTDNESDPEDVFIPPVTQVKSTSPPKESIGFGNFKIVKKGESYSSHLAYADNPLYQHMVTSNSNVPECSDENVSSTSDYASIETVNRLSSASNYSAKITPQEEFTKNKVNEEGPFGFCNPNYLGPDIRALMNQENQKKCPYEETKIVTEDSLEMHTYNGTINKNSKVVYKHASRRLPPKSLSLDKTSGNKGKEVKHRASSASRAEKQSLKKEQKSFDHEFGPSEYVPLYIYIIGGKEQGQVTVFKRPLSIWKLKLF